MYSPAKAIVEAHHGQIRAHSDGSGTGARFEIILPIAPRGQQDDLQQTIMKYRLDTLICLAEGDGAA